MAETYPSPTDINEILIAVEPDAEQMPEQFLRLICEESAQMRDVNISEETSGESFLTWDQIQHIAEIAKLIASCLAIIKTTRDIVKVKEKLPTNLRDHKLADTVINIALKR